MVYLFPILATAAMLVPLLSGPASAATVSPKSAPRATTPVMGTYVSMPPFRITDTRSNSGEPNAGKTLTAGSTLDVQVTGLGSVPAGASAAVLNVTAVDPTAAGFLTVYPAGTSTPTVSNLNFTPGETVANLVTVPLSSSGAVSIFNYAGSTNVVVDVEGYYTSTPATDGIGLYNPISPVRALGTLAVGRSIAANSSLPVVVAGSSANDGVPSTATAVVANLTAERATAPSFLTVYPAGAARPLASNLNFPKQARNVAIANRVTVEVGTSGQIEVYNHAGTVDVDVDVDGYYTGLGGTGSVFVPITPVRVADTRTSSLVGAGTPIAPNTTESFLLAAAGSGIPAGTATAVAANFTVISGDAPGYLTVYPTSDTTNPVASDVNWVANESVPNFTIADIDSAGKVDVFNSHGATINLAIDVFGYFEPSNAGPIMVSAVVTDKSIAITYNEPVSCPASASSDFSYEWTGSASGGAITSGSCTTSGDVLTLTGSSFTLPGSTGGTIVYTAPANNSDAVYATNNPTEYEATQSLAVPAATVVPAMVSAYETGSTLVVTYNEDVTCPTNADANGDFVYNYTGVATDQITGCTVSGPDQLTLDLASAEPPAPGTLVYTAPATNSPATAVWATGSSSPVLYAATQTLSGSMWTTPTITAAVVNSSTQIELTFNEPVACPTTGADADFVYDSSTGTSGGAVTGCSNASADQLYLTGAFTLPGSTASIAYTAPGSPTSGASGNAVYSPNNFPQFAKTQTTAVTVPPTPVMVSAVVTGASIVITYNENVTCPTAAYSDFVYYSSGTTSGGAIASCSGTTTVTLLPATPPFDLPVGTTGSIVYNAPATNSQTASVFATGTSVYAPTQKLTLTGIPAMVSAVVTSGSIAITYGQPVSCPTTGADADFVYDSVTVPNPTPGGTVTGCTSSGDVLTLTATGGFNAPQGTAAIIYTEPGTPTVNNAVYATGTTVFATSQTLGGASITS